MNVSQPVDLQSIFFVTLRLRDALPESFCQNLRLQYYSQQVKFAQHPDRSERLQHARKKIFARFDEALDLEQYGHPFLREPELAQIVADEVRRRDGLDYTLLACSVMPNHAHLLFDLHDIQIEDPLLDELEPLPCAPLRRLIADLQDATEKPLKEALRRLGRPLAPDLFQMRFQEGPATGGRCWHEQHFDFQISHAAERKNVVRYILQNPVKAYLADHWEG